MLRAAALSWLAASLSMGAALGAQGARSLILYKSSEGQSAAENEGLYHASGPLAALGLPPSYWDMDAGLPGPEAMRGVRALVSWFRGPAMRGAEAYVKFLAHSADEGVKIVVIDNFGAYQEASTGAWLDPSLINLALSRLGLVYQGDWTEDPSKIRLSVADASMVEKEAKQDASYSRLFYKFVAADRDLKVYLSASRTDRAYDPSPLVASNGKGGFALSRYVYRSDGGKVRFLLDVERFLRAAIYPKALAERVALVYDERSDTSRKILRYASQALAMAKLPFEAFERLAFAAKSAPELGAYTAIGLILPDDSAIDPRRLEAFVAEGGGLVSLQGGSFPALGRLLGGQAAANPKLVKGYRVRAGWILGDALAPQDPAYEWGPGSLSPLPGTEEIASDYNGESKAAWRVRDGRVVTWNWDVFENGEHQGLILQSFLAVRPLGMAGMAGIASFQLDDWPLPMFDIAKAATGGTDTAFYADRWWPDMKALLAKRGIPYTAYIVFNYNARVEEPFASGEFFASLGQRPLALAREILESGNELGLHGYNHVSLTTRPSGVNLAFWPDASAMDSALSATREEWSRLFGAWSLPVSYAAPNNIIDREGLAALARAFPAMRAASTLFASNTGEESVQDYGPDPGGSGLFLMPRTSYGYLADAEHWSIASNSVAGLGLFNHFVHPDDVYDPERAKGRSWPELRDELERLLGLVEKHYPWLRWLRMRDAQPELERYLASPMEFRIAGSDALIRARPGSLIQLRLPRVGAKLRLGEGAELVRAYPSSPFAVIRMLKAEARIGF